MGWPALLTPPLSLELLWQQLLVPSPLALPLWPPLVSSEELSSSRVSFWEPLLPAEERGPLKVTKMLPSLSCPTQNPLNATDVSSATWLLVPSPTKTKSCPFSTAKSPLSPPNSNMSPLPRLARSSRTLDCAKSVTPAH